MTSSLKRKQLSKPTKAEQIAPYDLALVRGRNKNRAHGMLLESFAKSGMCKADLAKMLNKRPEQISRWLGGPGNLTLDTLSELLFAIKGEFLEVSSVDELSRGKSNHCMFEWWKEKSYAQSWTVAKSSGVWATNITSSGSSSKVEIHTITTTRTGGKYENLH
jgi:hypothetical protein